MAKKQSHKVKKYRQKSYKNRGYTPLSENKECGLYLGVHIAERVLSHVFNDVERMPINNPGYDFICNHGKKIDVKSSCLYADPRSKSVRWIFHIGKNKIADYFLCLVFDNRTDLNPMFLWLLPAKEFNHLSGAAISINTIYKWNQYKISVGKITACSNKLWATPKRDSLLRDSILP